MGRIAVAAIVTLWVVPISVLVNHIVPEPYMVKPNPPKIATFIGSIGLLSILDSWVCVNFCF